MQLYYMLVQGTINRQSKNINTQPHKIKIDYYYIQLHLICTERDNIFFAFFNLIIYGKIVQLKVYLQSNDNCK